MISFSKKHDSVLQLIFTNLLSVFTAENMDIIHIIATIEQI